MMKCLSHPALTTVVLITTLASCMPPQQQEGEVKSFDANACVNWENLKKGYEADLSLINISNVDLDPNTNTYLTADESVMAQLAVLTVSSASSPRAVNAKDEEIDEEINAKDEENSEPIRVEDVYIKQMGSDKDAWQLKKLTNVYRNNYKADTFPNRDLAKKIFIKTMLEAVMSADPKGKLSMIKSEKERLRLFTNAMNEEFKNAHEMAHYAGTSTDKDGTTEVHIIFGRGVPTQDEISAAMEQGGTPAKSDDKGDLTDEELDELAQEQAVSPAALTLFHKGKAYATSYPAAIGRTEDLSALNDLMPGVVNKLIGKIFNASCDGNESAYPTNPNKDKELPTAAANGR